MGLFLNEELVGWLYQYNLTYVFYFFGERTIQVKVREIVFKYLKQYVLVMETTC
jgi:hypothetical protein